LILALWATDLLVAAVPDNIPRLGEAGVDARVLFFTLGVSVLTGIVFGLVPALQASRPDLNETLKEGERGSTGTRHRLRNALVVAEVAVALVLLVGAGLMVRSFWQLRQVETGFEARNVLTMQLSVAAKEGEGQKALNFFEDVAGRVRSLPGVEAVAFSNGLPFAGAVEQWLTVEGKQNSSGEPLGLMSVQYLTTPDYFRAMGIGLVRGRSFTEQDRQDAQLVAVVDERLAEKVFPGEEAVGQRFKTGSGAGPYEIVGVVEHVKHYGLEGEVPVDPQFYIPLSQVPAKFLPMQVGRISLVVRTKGDPAALAPAVRQQVLAADPNQPVFNTRTMEEIVSRSTAQRRFAMTLLTIFAGVALLLAAVGIYGVMSYAVTQRTHEIGIRMALGASGGSILGMVVRQGMLLVGLGVALGVVAALLLTRVMSSMLYGVSASDPATFGGISALLAGVAFLACFIPARRATRVDPMVALRYE
jgi:putative ABC transport system permease protein